MNLHRRTFLQYASLAATAATLPRWAWSLAPALRHDPFRLGVASGEPTADGMVLWTRILPDPGTGPDALQGPLTVHWELAHDAAFRRIVQRGQAQALPALGHSVHVELRGLQADRWYHYRFMLGDAVSATGRTRTAPADTQLPTALRLAFASCQRWEDGHYAAWRHVCADAPDLVLFLGDYIYENAIAPHSTGLARMHALPRARTLADYRARYALHKGDPALQMAHAACPWAVVWDDHEVQNDYAADQGGLDAPAAFVAQRNAGWQAFYENMPLRAASMLSSEFSSLQIYRRLRWGRLAQLHLLDNRQYRHWQACRKPGTRGAGAVQPADCPELADPQRSLLGTAQEHWLDAGLAEDAQRGHTQWSVIAQQTLFSPRRYPSGLQSTDSWDGYPAARARLLQSIAQQAPRNTVLLGGDIHQNYVCEVLDTPAGTGAAPRVLASEFCGTSISSRSGTTQARVDAIVRHNPHVLFARCEQRGYGLAEVTRARWTTSLRVLEDALDADSGIGTQARFVVEDGRPGPVAA